MDEEPGNDLLKPCFFCRLARERNGRGSEYRRPAGPEWRPAGQRDREWLTKTLFILQASTRTKWTRSWVPPTRWPRMAACCPTGRRMAPRPRNRSAEWAPNHQLTGKDVTHKTDSEYTPDLICNQLRGGRTKFCVSSVFLYFYSGFPTT